MLSKTKRTICFFAVLLVVTMRVIAIDYTPRIDVTYMFEDDLESIHTLTTDSILTVGRPFFLVVDISVSVPNAKLPLFAQRSIWCAISFYSPQIIDTTIVEGAGGIFINEKHKPNISYNFKVGVQPTIVGTDNKPVSIAPTTIRIRCEPIKTGTQEIHMVFDRLFINKAYNKSYIVTIK